MGAGAVGYRAQALFIDCLCPEVRLPEAYSQHPGFGGVPLTSRRQTFSPARPPGVWPGRPAVSNPSTTARPEKTHRINRENANRRFFHRAGSFTLGARNSLK